ncbi:unnamed protein product [Rhizophagus irregularis]|nr:unnamed protein product [Rhizophagus irregularis]
MTKRNNKEIEIETGSKKNQRTLPRKRRGINIEETNQLLLDMNTRQKHNESEKEVIVEEDVRDKSEEEEEEEEEDDDDDNDKIKYDYGMSRKARGYLDKTRKSLTDFRNKFNQNILNLVREYKEIRKSRGTTGNLFQKEIKDYVDENVVQKLLNRQLATVNILELTNNGGMDTLVEFVKEAVRISWDGKNLPSIKELDTMTKNIL